MSRLSVIVRQRNLARPAIGLRLCVVCSPGPLRRNTRMRNVAAEVRTIRYASVGFHTWTIEEVRQFQGRHPGRL